MVCFMGRQVDKEFQEFPNVDSQNLKKRMIAFNLMHDEHVTLNNTGYIDYHAIYVSEFCEFYEFWAF